MKKILLAAFGVTLMTGLAVDTASAAQRHVRGTTVQTPVRGDEPAFRNSYNSYGRADARRYDAPAYGGAISAPAGR